MADEHKRDQIPIPNDNSSFPFELWKDGEFLRGYVTLDDATADRDRGNQQSGKFEVRANGQRI